jgi:NAD(P)H dehydrogenase (quinone)
MAPRLAVIYYSATGHGSAMAEEIRSCAEAIGAEVRVRHIAETADPASVASNPAWTRNYEATKSLPAATGDDLIWADAVIFGSPTRFSDAAAPFQAFIHSLGSLWADGLLADKVYAAYTSSQTLHGGQETTLVKMYTAIMHFGGIIVAPGFTDPVKFADGNPYGVSHVTGPDNREPLSEATKAALRHMTQRALDKAALLSTQRIPSWTVGA